MRLYLILITLLILLICAGSCRKDFEYTPSNGNLEFSRDTVFLDTVFANIGSSTYSLKVYNRSKEDISIPYVGLAQGETSSYRLNVDGVAGKTFADIPLMAKDSLYIFIETTTNILDKNLNELLYTDILEFGKGSSIQQVPLVTLVKDAIFLYPKNSVDDQKESVLIGSDANGNEIIVPGFELKPEQLQFTNDKPYVIYGFAVIPEQQRLNIDAGARVYFHENSGIYVQAKASLSINGTLSTDSRILENEVIFEGDRLEPEYSDVSGQWEGIRIANGSINNTINHLTLRNATVAIFAQGGPPFVTPTLTIKNSQIYNSSRINLWGKTAVITGENLVLSSAGNSSLYCNLGGSYSFTHTTIANYWTEGYRPNAALTINNFDSTNSDGSAGVDLIKADFNNCIIDGNNALELSHSSDGLNTYDFLFSSCLITANTESIPSEFIELYDFENSKKYNNTILNENPDFINTSRDNFRLKPNSPAKDSGDQSFLIQVPEDILGVDRTELPDIGAYEFTSQE